MRLHENTQLFANAIEAAARPQQEGGLGIKSIFIEKDYWICRSLSLMPLGVGSSLLRFPPEVDD